MNADNSSEPKRLIHLLETADQYTDPQKNAAMQNLARYLMEKPPKDYKPAGDIEALKTFLKDKVNEPTKNPILNATEMITPQDRMNGILKIFRLINNDDKTAGDQATGTQKMYNNLFMANHLLGYSADGLWGKDGYVTKMIQKLNEENQNWMDNKDNEELFREIVKKSIDMSNPDLSPTAEHIEALEKKVEEKLGIFLNKMVLGEAKSVSPNKLHKAVKTITRFFRSIVSRQVAQKSEKSSMDQANKCLVILQQIPAKAFKEDDQTKLDDFKKTFAQHGANQTPLPLKDLYKIQILTAKVLNHYRTQRSVKRKRLLNLGDRARGVNKETSSEKRETLYQDLEKEKTQLETEAHPINQAVQALSNLVWGAQPDRIQSDNSIKLQKLLDESHKNRNTAINRAVRSINFPERPRSNNNDPPAPPTKLRQ